MKKILFTRESPCLHPILDLIREQKHRTLVLWGIEYGERILPIFENRYPEDERPRKALETANLWARGEIKMPVAKKAAHAAHNAATEVVEDPAACAAARAMGHVVGTVHVETHAIGVVMYGLTALVRSTDPTDVDRVIAEECEWLIQRLLHWKETIDSVDRPWAKFLLRDDVPNKEKLLSEGQASKTSRKIVSL